ncbi:helix-turn-helix transcriptional regulator [Mucilaginibacter sp. Bleaf8]|uniref:helix-turn-helix transcriptional regulator n=1 Tax=Mucilaginibacter sp. Bleaf8 TaxID=2834430 RepID=UPI001BD0468A|nr:AraC family transcriptional regulator [Mucilaginibacter sp. Bleaf8]MBS7564109.1 helix-turn-helix transcriptional regulator [Mucilaginibacter sp. Bleaf8]
MEITFSSQFKQPSEVKLSYPKEFSSDTYLDERETSATAPWGTMHFKECWFNGACLLCSEFEVQQQSTVKLRCDNFCWLMNFVLKGELKLTNATYSLDLRAGKYHTFYCSELDMDLTVKSNATVFTICLTRRFIRKLLGKDLLPEQFESGSADPFTMVATDAYSSGRFTMLLQELMQARQPSHIRRIYLEAKILELLSLQLENLEQQQTVPGNFSQEDVTRLQEAKKIVEQNLRTPCSLIELARKTGLNDFKLKRGFKTLFGNTVFGYLADVRMQTAYRYLTDGKTVSEVAETVGYKNPHHFTAAFKKKFGFLPSQVVKPVAT